VAVAAPLTVWFRGELTVLGANLVSPLYVALMVWRRTSSVEVEKVAISWPATTWSETGACAVPSMEKVTVPVGVPLVADVTVAVNVTVWPRVEGLTEELSAVAVAAVVATAIW